MERSLSNPSIASLRGVNNLYVSLTVIVNNENRGKRWPSGKESSSSSRDVGFNALMFL